MLPTIAMDAPLVRMVSFGKYDRKMCTRYVSPDVAAIERVWHVGRHNPWRGKTEQTEMFPGYPGPFIRRNRESSQSERELVTGQWNLIPWFAKESKLKYATNNARSEELAEKASYKLPWARGQRCIIPASMFYEPNWETGKHIPWAFRRADGEPFGLAGLWNTWTSKNTDEVIESFTMLTLNADQHPLMARMHRPDPKRPPNMQDKRSTIPIELEDVGLWLFGTVEEASLLLRLTPAEMFDAAPA